jgi:hypothetical protein
MLGTFACKKNETTPPLQNQGLEANQSTNDVVQKLYDLNYSQTNAVVTSFKNQFNTAVFSKSTNNNAVLQLDSSVWILEAALNSDFDSDKGDNEVFHDSLVITAPINNNTILVEDMGVSYLALKNLVSQKKSTNKGIELIDVKGRIDNNTIIYTLDIVFYNISSSHKTSFTFACDPFYTEIASPSLSAPVSPNIYNHFLACSSNPTLDAPTILQNKLNGCGISLCAFGYYTNITNLLFNASSGTNYNALYIRNAMLPADFCLTTNNTISTAMLNQYRGNIKNLATTNIPSSPANMRIVNYSILYNEDFLLCSCANQKFQPLWKLTVKYAVLNCP